MRTYTRKTHCHRGHPYDHANTYTWVNRAGHVARTCRACARTKVLAWQAKNRGKVDQTRALVAQRVNEFLIAAKSGGCRVCGESDVACLDFHHRDPATKSFNIGFGMNRARKRAVLIAEIAKCDLLCANCHRKHHWAERHAENVA